MTSAIGGGGGSFDKFSYVIVTVTKGSKIPKLGRGHVSIAQKGGDLGGGDEVQVRQVPVHQCLPRLGHGRRGRGRVQGDEAAERDIQLSALCQTPRQRVGHV